MGQLASESTVALLGDWHGNTNWARRAVHKAAEDGKKVLLHVGDFGVWPDTAGEKYLRKLDKWCEELDLHLIVTPGNHENWTRLEKGWKKDNGPTQLGFKRFWFLPRNTRFTLNEVTFMSFGGAASVDYTWRERNKTWWPQEFPSEEDVEAGVASGPADILVLHETPDLPYATEGAATMITENPMGFSEAGREYSAESRSEMTKVMEAVRPRLTVHGHMHHGEEAQRTYKDGENFTVLSLNKEFTPTNMIYLDLTDFHDKQTLDLAWVDPT